MKFQLILPMATYVLYMWLLAILNFRVRVGAVRSGKMSHKFFKAFSGEASDRVIIVGRHYDNQFQLPMLFFAVLIAFLACDVGNWWTVGLAWAFIATRFVHSFVHLGSNRIQRRVLAFAAGWLVVLALWAQLLAENM